MLDPNLAYFWISLPFPRHAINPQKTSASEGTLLLFHAGAFPLLLICYVCDIHIYIYISPVSLSLILKQYYMLSYLHDASPLF